MRVCFITKFKKIYIIYVPTFVVSIPSHEFFRDDTWFDNPRKSSDNIHIETFWIFYGNNVFTSQSLSSICHVPVTQWFFKLIILDFSIMIGERQSCVKKHWLYIFFSKTVHNLLMCIKHRHCIFPRHKFTQKLLRQLHRISFMNNNRGSGIPEDANGKIPPPSLLLII